MARSISEIQAAIAADRAARAELAGLTSNSATAVYGLIEYVVAVAQWVHETVWDRFRAEVDALIAAAPAGTAGWYAARALEFQLGDLLVVLPTGKPGYAPGTRGAKIVTRASAIENPQTRELFLKVAKDDGAGGLAALDSATELRQVRGYFDRIRFAGTPLRVVSREADRLRIHASVYYDPLQNLAALKTAVATALAGYLASLAFDGLVFVAKLEDAIQAVPGVKDVQVVSVLVNASGVDTLVNRVYETAAGYVVLESNAGYTPADTLVFVPYAQ